MQGERGIVATVFVEANEERNDWTWSLFTFDEPECVRVVAIGGRARVYRLRVSIRWGL